MRKLSRRAALDPEILIFDVDGVLVDVRQTYWRSAMDTMRFLTGKRVTYQELHQWKAKPGNNDDWNMVANWATSLGRPTTYDEAQEAFGKFYWGANGRKGNVRNEKHILPVSQLRKWAKHYEINLFTGRTRQEFTYTFGKWPGTKYFRLVVTMSDVEKIKPNPEGLYKILGGRDPKTALYIGDNIDDALAAREAKVPFLAIIAAGEHGYRERAKRFLELGALRLLPKARTLDRYLLER